MALRTRLIAGVVGVSLAGLGFLSQREGTSLSAYPDPTYGWTIPTICKGHTGPDVYRGLVATPAMCNAWLSADAQKAAQAVLRCSGTYPFKQHEFDALVSFTVNTGEHAYCSSDLSRDIRSGNTAGATKQFDRWVYSKHKDCRVRSNNCYGVYTRRMAEKRLFAKGEYE